MGVNRKVNIFNIDYEYDLFGLLEGNEKLKKKIERIGSELEYVYFLEQSESILKTSKKYDSSYLDYLKVLA